MPTRFGIDVGPALQVLRAGHDVLVLGVPALAGVGGVSERLAVADAAPVVHREDDVALRREPLVHRVGQVVEPHVVVAEQHLAHRAAVHEDERRTPLARLQVLRQEQLVVDLESVGGLGQHVLGDDERVERVFLRQRRVDDLRRAARGGDERDRLRAPGVGGDAAPPAGPRRPAPDRFRSPRPWSTARARRPRWRPSRRGAARCPRGCCSRTSCGRRGRAT